MADITSSTPSKSRLVSPVSLASLSLPPNPSAASSSSMDSFFASGLSLSPGAFASASPIFSESYHENDYRFFPHLLHGPMEHSSGGYVMRNEGDNHKAQEYRHMSMATTPILTVPPGLSPTALLTSPGFHSNHQNLFRMPQPPQSEYHNDVRATTMLPTDSLITGAAVAEPRTRTHCPAIAVDKPADDGYNWRKYGQKPIKGCEYPRSYYKCTSASCPVKKKVERSSDGHITQIIYKGQHNHEMPQNRRLPAIRDHGLIGGFGEFYRSNGAARSVESSQSDEGDKESPDEDADDEDEYVRGNKIRRIGDPGVSMSHKTVTEPKIVVQTRSDVDLLDDGYRWRKYGQKVVKGNPHPRSYYKCTTTGCTVRKHVERASTDPEAVMTTYEGKHNHDLPAARGSSNGGVVHRAPGPFPMVSETGFGGGGRGGNQRPVPLRLKEEEITV